MEIARLLGNLCGIKGHSAEPELSGCQVKSGCWALSFLKGSRPLEPSHLLHFSHLLIKDGGKNFANVSSYNHWKCLNTTMCHENSFSPFLLGQKKQT